MPVDVLTETVIKRPLAQVADYATDPGNAPQWYANIVRVEWETHLPWPWAHDSPSRPASSAAGSPTPTRSSSCSPGSAW